MIKLLSDFVDNAIRFVYQETVEGMDTELYFVVGKQFHFKNYKYDINNGILLVF